MLSELLLRPELLTGQARSQGSTQASIVDVDHEDHATPPDVSEEIQRSRGAIKLAIVALTLIWLARAVADVLNILGLEPHSVVTATTVLGEIGLCAIVAYQIYISSTLVRMRYLYVLLLLGCALVLLRSVFRVYSEYGPRVDFSPYQVAQLAEGVIANAGAVLLVGSFCVVLVALRNSMLNTRRDDQRLQRSETRFRAIYDRAPVGIAIVETASGRYRQVNDAFSRITGYSEVELRALNIMGITHPDDLPNTLESRERLCRGEIDHVEKEKRYIRKDGSIVWADVRIVPLTWENKTLVRHLAIVHDITAAKRTERQLRESEERYRVLFEGNPAGILAADAETKRFSYVNPAACEMFGYSTEEFTRKTIEELHPPGLLSNNNISAPPKGGKQFLSALPCVRKNGSIFYADLSGMGTTLDGRKLLVGFLSDVTERKQAEDAHRQSEERVRIIAGTIEDVFWLGDVNLRRMLYVSSAFERVWGRSCESACASPLMLMNAVHKEDRRRVLAALNEDRVGKPFSREFRIVRPDGSVRTIWNQGFPVRDSDGQVTSYAGIATDITERRQKELEQEELRKQLHLAQKMESVGRLAGGIAHDFNNMLVVILGYGGILAADLADSPYRESINELVAAGERAKILVRQLLAFSRKQVLDIKIVDINGVIRGLEKMLGRLIGEDIQVQTVLKQAPVCVKADPGQLEQVLLNLCVNARDAMPTGGRLTIETSRTVIHRRIVHPYGVIEPGAYAQLEVSDTGIGMDETVRTQIFDPFFTTKEKGKGTGLGLATVFGIVKQHGGEILVESEPGKGAKFRIYLPEHESIAIDIEPGAHETVTPGNGEVVLVLEDDEYVRSLLCRLLAKLGYHVVEARNADECLSRAQTLQKIDLFITDIVMPDMNGKDVSDLVNAVHPGIKTLFVSGYSEDIIAERGVLMEGIQFIPKPFNKYALSKKIREVLEM